MKTYNTQELNSMKVAELKTIATEMKIKNSSAMKKADLIKAIYEGQLVANATPTPKVEQDVIDEAPDKEAPKAETTEPKETKSEDATSQEKPVFHRSGGRRRSRMTFR